MSYCTINEKVELIGKQFGRLTVDGCIYESQGKKNGYGRWLCKCICGTIKEINGRALIYKNGSKSCGCLQLEKASSRSKKRAPDRVTITAQYCTHRGKGVKKGLGFLPKEDWLKLVFEPCHYCGEIDTRNNLLYSDANAPNRYTEAEIREYDKQINGIDRIDSSIGYVLDNCVPCCMQCNNIKMHYSQESFYRKVELITNRRAYSDVTLEQYLCN